METQVISYYNPSHQSQSRACRPTDALMWKIGENVEIIKLKEEVKKLKEASLAHQKVAETALQDLDEWKTIGLDRFSSDEPDDVDYSIQSLIDDHNQAEEDFEEEKKDLEAENKKLKEDLAYANRRWGVSLDRAILQDDYLTQLAYYCEDGSDDEYEVFHKITNNEFKEE